MNVKVFSLMSRPNETGHVKWHEAWCKCRLYASVCNNKQRWKNDKCRCECKEVVCKGICDKGFICNPSNCECDKSCDVGEYLDYANCKCRKKLVYELVKECSETNDEAILAEITLAEDKKNCKSFCTIYIVLISTIFTISIGIGTNFIYYKYMIKKLLLDMIMSIKHQIININGRYQRIKH